TGVDASKAGLEVLSQEPSWEVGSSSTTFSIKQRTAKFPLCKHNYMQKCTTWAIYPGPGLRSCSPALRIDAACFWKTGTMRFLLIRQLPSFTKNPSFRFFRQPLLRGGRSRQITRFGANWRTDRTRQGVLQARR